MATARQTAANRKNALASTGPKTGGGRLAVRGNAAKHGLSAVSPVLPGEDPRPWESFRAAVAADLRPQGAVELLLAERYALLQWRQRRVVAHEAALAGEKIAGFTKEEEDRLAKAEAQLTVQRRRQELPPELPRLLDLLRNGDAGAVVSGEDVSTLIGHAAYAVENLDLHQFDPDLLSHLGRSESEEGDPYANPGWTVADLDKAVAYCAGQIKVSPESFEALLQAKVASDQVEAGNWLKKLRRERKAAQRALRQKRAQLAERFAVPEGDEAERIMEIEAHLQRQSSRLAEELRERQAARLALQSGRQNAPEPKLLQRFGG